MVDVFKAVKVQKVSDEIVRQIIALIAGGRLQPGDKLPSERDLCDRLGVGRSSLREALTILETMGLVEIRKRQGNFVKGIATTLDLDPFKQILREDPAKIDAFYEIRNDVELASAAAAARNRTAEDLVQLRQALKLDRADNGALPLVPYTSRDDRDFHVAVAQATHNFLRVHVVKHLFDYTREFNQDVFAKIIRSEENVSQVLAQHEAIYKAIEQQDQERARGEMEAHLTWVNKTIRNYLSL